MTPVDQQQVDRILAVVDALKSTAKSLERLHEVEAGRAIEYFDRASSLDMAASEDLIAPKPNALTK
jgi:hypothetical protein